MKICKTTCMMQYLSVKSSHVENESPFIIPYLHSKWKQTQRASMPLLILCMVLTLTLFLSSCSSEWLFEDRTVSARPEGPIALPAGWEVYMPDKEFSSVWVQEGVVYAGGLNGLFRQSDGNEGFAEIRNDDIPFRLVKGLLTDDAGRLWVGHDKGVSCVLPGANQPVSTLSKYNEKAIGAVNALMLDRSGTLYVGTFDGALTIHSSSMADWIEAGDTSGFGWMGTEEGLIHPMVNAMLEDSRGTLWFGAYIARGGGLTAFHGDTIQYFTHENGLPTDFVTTLAEDTDGSVWVGTGVYLSGGASQLIWHGNAYESEKILLQENGLAGDKVRYIHIEPDGTRWFCSEYDGAAVFDASGNRLHLLTMQDGLPDNEIKRMAEAQDGSLWLACHRGLMRMDAAAVARLKVSD